MRPSRPDLRFVKPSFERMSVEYDGCHVLSGKTTMIAPPVTRRVTVKLTDNVVLTPGTQLREVTAKFEIPSRSCVNASVSIALSTLIAALAFVILSWNLKVSFFAGTSGDVKGARENGRVVPASKGHFDITVSVFNA